MENSSLEIKMGNTNSSSVDDDWLKSYKKIKSAHDTAYTIIEQAITLEEQEKPHEAIEKYHLGILEIDKALNIQVTCPERPDANWNRAVAMIHKMKQTRAEVLTRINSIQMSKSYQRAPPPSYNEAVASTSNSSNRTEGPTTYSELAEALNTMQPEDHNRSVQFDTLYEHDGVRLYLISPDGQVVSSSAPSIMIIGVYEAVEDKGTAFLQIGNWIYPLIPGVSPCYRTDYGAFIFPDVHSDEPGTSVGLILPKEIDQDVYEILENILHGIVTQSSRLDRKRLQEERTRTKPPLTNRVSAGLIRSAQIISEGLIKGASKTADVINSSTPKVLARIPPATEPTPVNKTVAKTVKVAEAATSGAAHVTGVVAGAVGTATMKLGRFLAPHIQKQGTRILKSHFNYTEEEAASKMNQVLTVAASAVEGFSTVYSGLETSAAILGTNLRDNTVKIVNHKYGGEAGEVTNNTLLTVGNVMAVKHNLKVITPKGVAKQTASSTVFSYNTMEQDGQAGQGGKVENLPMLMEEDKSSTSSKKDSA